MLAQAGKLHLALGGLVGQGHLARAGQRILAFYHHGDLPGRDAARKPRGGNLQIGPNRQAQALFSFIRGQGDLGAGQKEHHQPQHGHHAKGKEQQPQRRILQPPGLKTAGTRFEQPDSLLGAASGFQLFTARRAPGKLLRLCHRIKHRDSQQGSVGPDRPASCDQT